jgi:hypothetical protein
MIEQLELVNVHMRSIITLTVPRPQLTDINHVKILIVWQLMYVLILESNGVLVTRIS